MGCCQTKLAKGANGKVKLEAVDDEGPENEPKVLGGQFNLVSLGSR